MRSKALWALAVAGAFSLPASYANDANHSGYLSSDAASASAPVETWYYPDGTVVYRDGNVAVTDVPGRELSISSMDRSGSGASQSDAAALANGDMLGGLSDDASSETWIIAGQAVEPEDDFLIID